MSLADNSQIILAKWKTTGTLAGGYVVAPGSGATITIFDSGDMGANPTSSLAADGGLGINIRRVCMTNWISHDSAASGVTFEALFDTNWRLMVAYSDTNALNANIHWVATPWARWRIRYQNSASVLTTWEGSLMGDEYVRSTQ